MGIIKEVFALFILAMFITQVIIPIFLNKKLFWLFRKHAPTKVEAKTPEKETEKPLKETVEDVKKQYAEAKKKVDEHFSQAQDLKSNLDEMNQPK